MVRYLFYHEGQLTKCKNGIVCNNNLLTVGDALGLHRFICANPYVPAYFVPIGFRSDEQRDREISDNTISDVVEAILGAYFLYCGENLTKARKDVLVPFGIVNLDSADLSIDLSKLFPPKLDVRELTPLMPLVESVQHILQYRFKNSELLLEALTHSSFEHTTSRCYQRLEFLGDAVLDLIIVTHLYHLEDELPPGVISKWKSTIVSNEILGYALVRSGLHNFIRFSSVTLREDIENFISNVNLSSSIKDILYPTSCAAVSGQTDVNPIGIGALTPPKVLGDVFESVLGAIYIDSDGDISVARQFVTENLISHYLDEAYAMSNDFQWGVHENPASVLPEILSKLNCCEWKFEFSVDETGSTYCCEITIHNISEIARARTKAMAKKKVCSSMLRGDPGAFLEHIWTVCKCSPRSKIARTA